ncbi:PHA/PHB synthase family protein [Croceibacterium aestuarii]|uniref:PHA/PHB synthase family protein n=1 Tax=Croceibacterium aestuarii TaxID=3064139 RepID=UPI00272E28B3|nr:class I poly(R)-hydroxyalkanoic acid synthase [Croceibacterium sp. D39]
MDETESGDAVDVFAEMLKMQSEAARAVLATTNPDERAVAEWTEAAGRLQKMWLEFHVPGDRDPDVPVPMFADPAQWFGLVQEWQRQVPWLDPERQGQLMAESAALWDQVLTQFGLGSKPDSDGPEVHLPRSDRRFSDPAWREQPVYALIHQTYLLFAERMQDMIGEVGGLDEAERDQLRFALRGVLDAMSPANFPLTNPVVLERTLETHGANLVKGMERLIADLEKGQLTHTDSSKFRLGENIACTPGKVVHETRLYQLIQYSPDTEEVAAVPVVIFPPWINRFYILDLNPKKSFVKWAVEQGLTVFMVSWKSADETMADVTWDDYVRAQIDAIDHIRERLGVRAVHTIGYCVAGTTLAATLAILARRGEADKVASTTFFTAQVDFERAGELKYFVDETQLALIKQASQGGYLDGRYMAATFNLLRGTDLIWNYVVNHYLLGEDYPAFDLLHWNGDVTNLPAKWHARYLRDLYRDNKLVQPDVMSADGTPIDLRLIETPAYVQAGREDHIAPAGSVWKLTGTLAGPVRFVLAGSGHIAGVVNPPAARKYQYWTNETPAGSLEAFVAGATEHPGSWWTDWIAWLENLDATRVKATGKRKPGGKGDTVIEDAPGRYVAMR